MNGRLTAIVEREGDGYVALCPEVEFASQGDTMAEALVLFFETASADEVGRRLRGGIYVACEACRCPTTPHGLMS